MRTENTTPNQVHEYLHSGLQRAENVAKSSTELVGHVLGHVAALVTDVCADAEKVAAQARELHRSAVVGWVAMHVTTAAETVRHLAQELGPREPIVAQPAAPPEAQPAVVAESLTAAPAESEQVHSA